ncbi:MAG: cupin domain-containing protein [SAR324 cluster bacterium]|nr:cupin domain-containing protein [SAR324 cluster bacterium]
MKKMIFWIKSLDLQRYPNGGYLSETYHYGTHQVDSIDPLCSGLASYYLLPGNEFLAFNRLNSDILWHFYYGSTMHLHIMDNMGQYYCSKLGNNLDRGERHQVIVRKNFWYAATVYEKNGYALTGATIFSGEQKIDLEMGSRSKLLEEYPQHFQIIEKLTLP